MIFKQPKVKWPVEKIYERISHVKKDVSTLNKIMNSIDGDMNHLRHQKETARRKISKKCRYLGILGKQLNEAKNATVL